MILLYCAGGSLRRKQNVRSIEARLWLKAIHLNICSWGTPGSRPSARSNIFSLMDSLHYSSDPELLQQPHTARASSLFLLLHTQVPELCTTVQMSPIPFSVGGRISMQGGSATITQSIGFPWTITIAPSHPPTITRLPPLTH